jgi:hypothetical protein
MRITKREHLWRVTGLNRGKERTIMVRAVTHKQAVHKATHYPHRLMVRDCVLIDEEPEKSQQAAIAAARALGTGVTQ